MKLGNISIARLANKFGGLTCYYPGNNYLGKKGVMLFYLGLENKAVLLKKKHPSGFAINYDVKLKKSIIVMILTMAKILFQD